MIERSPLDLNSAWIFVRVVQAGSLSGASRQLGMPVSTVSTKISLLEKRLGVALLKRTTRKLHLTDAGTRYFEYASRACSAMQEAEASIASEQNTISGVVRLTTPTEMGSTSLPEVLSRFLFDYPQVQVELLLTDRIVDLIAEGVDLAIRVGELDDSTLMAKKMGSSEFQVYASPAYLKRKGEPKRPEDISNHSCLNFQGAVQSQWTLSKGAQNQDVKIFGSFAVNNLLALHQMARAGHGIALLPNYLCTDDLAKGRLKQVLKGWCAERYPVHLVYPQQRYIPKRVRALIDFLSKELKDVF